MEDLIGFEQPVTAGQLRAWLASVSDDTQVVLARDAEGNSLSPLAAATEARYVADKPWSGEILDEEDEDNPDSIPVVLLQPMN